ncbi:hypothetical protein GCM10020367_50560 [Streptomyces sannanensis]|uniref:SCO6045-like C-terminal domain-containing protein n=1 Tax=Streptomyces sannanensis TaxID=285536 RepID=A0ABP6SHC8_9ACTN
MERLGIGIGWRPEIADAIERLPGIDWVETVAENVCPGHVPDSLLRLRERGITVVPHGVSLGLGGAERPDAGRLADLAARAEALGSPLVTEHIAFVRAAGPLSSPKLPAPPPSPRLEAGHLLPVPRTWDALHVLCENVRIAQDALPVPLALENIAALISWPDEELTEGRFLAELVERTGVRLLVDVANLHTNHVNRGEDPAKALSELPLEAIAYVHVAGGVERNGVWHDTHAHPVPRSVLDILAELRSRIDPPGVLLERDDDFPPEAALSAELDAIRTTLTPPGARTGTDTTARAGALAAVSGGRTVAHAPHGTATRPGAAGDDASRGQAQAGAWAAGHLPVSDAAVTVSAPGHAAAQTVTRTAPPSVPMAATPVTGGADAVASAPAAAWSAELPHGGDGTAPDDARARLALAQAALLSALVAGAPAPEGFDSARLGVQIRALAAKRASVVAKVAPELPQILGDGYRPAFLAYAKARPLTGGYRRDALDFAEHLLVAGRPEDRVARRRLTLWWEERAAPRPPGRAARIVRAARAALTGLAGLGR